MLRFNSIINCATNHIGVKAMTCRQKDHWSFLCSAPPEILFHTQKIYFCRILRLTWSNSQCTDMRIWTISFLSLVTESRRGNLIPFDFSFPRLMAINRMSPPMLGGPLGERNIGNIHNYQRHPLMDHIIHPIVTISIQITYTFPKTVFSIANFPHSTSHIAKSMW